jgi:general secretion pathway protein L
MATCFLFTHQLTESGCLSLSLDQQGQIISPLLQRNFADIRVLQKNCRTIVVLPSSLFNIHRVTLPWISEKKARAAIPFALEDKLAQNVNLLHFAFDRGHYSNGQYLVAVGEKLQLAQLLAELDGNAIEFDLLTLDWFALHAQEAALLPQYLLLHNDNFWGALAPDIAQFYFSKETAPELNFVIYSFIDSNPLLLEAMKKKGVTEKQPDVSFQWIAHRLQNNKAINLCQGEFEHGGNHVKTKRWVLATLLMILGWLTMMIGTHAWKLHQFNQDAAALDKQIATIYREFFPDAQKVISPRFRIAQLLKETQNISDSRFWILLNNLAQSFRTGQMTIEQIRFQNPNLLVTLITTNFEELEALQSRLQDAGIKVRQTQASTEKGKVVGILELSL